MADEQHHLKQAEEREELAPEEFEILELEDRLELQNRCNANCQCPM
jgi:hypothetical protein